MFFSRIMQKREIKVSCDTTVNYCQLLTLTLVCADIHYNHRFVLYNKFQILLSFLRTRSKPMKVFIPKEFSESQNGVFIIFVKNQVNETFLPLSWINLVCNGFQRHIQNPVKHLRWSF